MIETRGSAAHFLGMPVEEFLRDYWQKKPLLIRRAFWNNRLPGPPLTSTKSAFCFSKTGG